MGEYVFDHAWAQAYERAGGAYYPKLQVAVPFTPVTGRRLLVAPDAPPGARDALRNYALAAQIPAGLFLLVNGSSGAGGGPGGDAAVQARQLAAPNRLQ